MESIKLKDVHAMFIEISATETIILLIIHFSSGRIMLIFFFHHFKKNKTVNEWSLSADL